MDSAQAGSALESDPRWRRLHDRSWVCPCCGETHSGIFDIAHNKPDPWQGGEECSPNSAAVASTHFLSEDFCVLKGEHFFLRCVLEIPILGTERACLGFGIWSNVQSKSFTQCVETFDDGRQGELGPWLGRIANQMNGYPDTFNLKCRIHPRSGRQRPRIEPESADHPLALDQRNGITFDRLLEIYAVNGHDLRSALAD